MPTPVWVECVESGFAGGGLIFGVILPYAGGPTYTKCATAASAYTEKSTAAATYTEKAVTDPTWTEGVE